MSYLVAGLLLWSMLHLLPATDSKLRRSAIEKIGAGPYKGLFSLMMIAAVALMVVGWRHSTAQQLFVASWLPLHAAYLLMLVAFYLVVASGFNCRIKRVLRHPQLTGFALWALLHVLVNGDSRSLVLFGGLALWAVLEIIALNRRDGEWHKPHPPALLHEAKPLLACVLVFSAVFYAHPYLSGHALPL